MLEKEAIINECLKQIGGENYLEIGVRHGTSIKLIRAKRSWGVDPKITLSNHPVKYFVKYILAFLTGTRFFQMTSDHFLSTQKRLLKKHGIDVALIDGLHTHEQTLKEVLCCLTYLKKGGILVLHDCNPSTPTMAYPAASFEDVAALNLPDWTLAWCGDVWKTIVYLRSFRKDLSVCVLNCDYGVGLIKVGQPESMLKLSAEDIKRLSYEDLASDRARLLNLKDPSFLSEFIRTA